MSQSTNHITNDLLGYPPDARLLILNADDFGMCHAITDAIFRTLQEGLVQSTTLMTPCPWAAYAVNILKANPDIHFGVHLTLICDTLYYRWGPLSSKDKVPSLVDETGYFYSYERIAEFVAQANVDEVEIEFRAQLDTVLAAGLQPTHLDWHCLHNGGRADIFDVTMALAKEHGLAVRIGGEPYAEQLQAQGLPTNDYELLDSFILDTSAKSTRYAQMLRELPPGLTEWAVHPGLDTPELQALEPRIRVRQTDYEFFMSADAREIIQQEGIILIDYAPIQAIWRAK